MKKNVSCRSKFELFYHYIPFLTFRNYFRGGRGGRERGEEWGRERGERGKERGAGEEKEEGRGRGKGGSDRVWNLGTITSQLAKRSKRIALCLPMT